MGNADDQRSPLAGWTHQRETGTEMNEQTMEKLLMAAWKEAEKEHKNYVAERIKAHSTNGKYLHQWIRQDYQTPIATMRTDGSITMNFQEIHQTLVEAWRPTFARWDGKEERVGRFIPNELMDAKRITGVELRDTVQHWSNNAAAGADSWKRCEWKQFTDAMFDQVADYLNNIEEVACGLSYKQLVETSIWPEDIRTTPVANIKKEAESPGPRDVRPITLAATLYCAWSSTRYREAVTWAQKARLHKTVHGGIPGSRVQNSVWPLLLKMEAMTKDEKEEGIATAAIDSEKYFDSICWEVTFQMLDRMGRDQRIWKLILNFITHLKRFNKVAGTLGRTWTCTNSIIQGCSLGLLATAALSSVWARVLEEEVPTVLCSSIVDDRRLCATGKEEAPKQLQSAIQITRDFDRTTGARFNSSRNKLVSQSPAKVTETEQTRTKGRMKRLEQGPESRVYPKASDSRAVRDSLKRIHSPGTNLPLSAGCRVSNPKVGSCPKSCAPSGRQERT